MEYGAGRSKDGLGRKMPADAESDRSFSMVWYKAHGLC